MTPEKRDVKETQRLASVNSIVSAEEFLPMAERVAKPGLISGVPQGERAAARLNGSSRNGVVAVWLLLARAELGPFAGELWRGEQGGLARTATKTPQKLPLEKPG